MKQKKNEMVDKAEIVDDPSKKYQEIKKINDEEGEFLMLDSNLKTFFNRIEADLIKDTSHDPDILKADTVDCIKNYFNKILSEFKILIELSSTIREKLYYLVYNTSIMFYDYIHKMRTNGYSLHGTVYLIWLISNFENNIVLSGLKFLKWRIKLYIELAFLYEDNKGYKSAFKVITHAVNKLNDLKAIEEQQGPLPDHIKTSFTESFRILKNYEFKYGILSGAFQLDVWKKKLDETFTEEKMNKYICAVNSIANLTCFNSIVNHDGLKISWKQQATAYMYEMIKADLLNIKTGIVEYIDMKKRYVEISKKMTDERNYDALLQETIQQNSQINKAWRVSSKNVPIEIHIELLKATYDCQMWKEFIDLMDSLNVRLKYRNVEVPFLSEVDIQMSSIQYANIPNKYEKIQIDLNVNNYKREIRRLREEGKYVSIKGGVQTAVGAAAHTMAKDNKKNEKDNKAGAGGAGAKKKSPIEDITEGVPNPYEKIEGIEHNFIYLLIRKSHNPKNAITDIRIVMSNDYKIKNELKENERAVAIPIKTFKDNLYEANEVITEDFTSKLLNQHSKLIPFLIIKKNKTGLETDKEKLAAITNLYPLVSNSPYGEPPMNYIKIDPEISLPGKANDPNYLKYNFNHNFINICYKTDNTYYIIEREVEILRNLYELENSYSETNEESKVNKFLGLNYSFEKLDLLATWIYNSIQGQIGTYFINERSNFLYDITILLWKKYLKNFLFRIDYFFKFENEFEEEQRKDIMEKILSMQNEIFNSLYCIHHVMSQLKTKDPIIYSFLASRLSDFSERTSNEATGVLILKDTLDYIESIKEKENIYGMNNEENKHSFTSFTCDNNKINELTRSINEKYNDYVHDLNLKRRQNYKTSIADEPKKVAMDEINEEDFEINLIEKEYQQRLKEKGIKVYTGLNDDDDNEGKKDKVKINYFVTENENTLNCVYIDLYSKFYRMYIKCGDTILDKYDFNDLKSTFKKNKPTSSSSLNSSHLSAQSSGKGHTRVGIQTLNKLNIIKGETAQYVKSNMEFLKHSLQDAGKLDPDKPILSKSERYMQMTISKNCYLNSLYQASLALMRPTNKQDQIFLLRLSCNHLEKCFSEEDQRCQYYKDNFFYIKSMERYNSNISINAGSFYPYNLLFKPIMIDPVTKIPEPFLINKTSKTCTFIFPVVKIKNNQLDKYYRSIPRIALYGQMSTGSNCVQLNNKNLNGTGQISSIMTHITVKDLKPNEKFIFAYAGYDTEDTIMNQIGATSKEVELYFPLPKFYLSYHVCKICYEYKHYSLCKERSKIVFNAFTERTELKDKDLDSKLNTCLFYKLKYEQIAKTSFIELEGVAYCFYFFAKSMIYLKPNDHSVELGTNLYLKQKNILKNLNVLSLGLEIAIYIRHYQLIKLFAYQIYSISMPFITSKNLYKELIPIYMKINMGINIIPSELWERSLRKISSLSTYTIFSLANSINETDIIKKLLINELGVSRKKYYPFKYKYLQKLDEDPKKKKNPKEKEKTPKTPKDIMKQGVDGSNPDEELKYKEVEETSLKDIERECIELDEYILSTGDYNDIMRNRILQYFNLLDHLTTTLVGKYPELQIEIDGKKKELTELIEVYDSFKAEGVKYLQKYITTSKDKDKFYEYTSKMIKKTIENFISSISSLNLTPYSLTLFGDKKGGAGGAKDKDNPLSTFPDILKTCEDIVIKESDIGFIQNIFNQKVQFLSQDILYKMKVRIHDYLSIIAKEIPHDEISQEIDLGKMGQQIEDKFFGCVVENEILPPYDTLSENDILSIKEKLYWIGDLLFNKALVQYTDFLSNIPTNHQSLLNYDFNNFFNYKLCDIKKIQDNQVLLSSETNNLKLLESRSGLFIKKENPPVEVVPEETVKDPKAKKPDPKPKKPANQNDSKEPLNAPIDPFDNHIERQFDIRHQKLTAIFEKLALASLCLSNVCNYKSIDNILSFAYNIILYDMLTPFDCSKDTLWSYIAILCEVALIRLDKIRKGDISFTEFNYEDELQILKQRISDNTFNAKPSSFVILNKSANDNHIKIDEEKIIEEYEQVINLDVYIEFICFGVQCIYNMKKWSILANLIETFNIVTKDLFNEFTLSFLIEAQTNLYEKAHLNTTNKQTEIKHRIEMYDNWKNSRKKNKRQQLITGEIPPEQIEFDRDYSILSKELHIFKSISDLLRTDKEKSESIYKSFVNDSNNALKAVQVCRKKYEEYQKELLSMKKYAYNYSVNFKEYQSKSKGLSYLTSGMINSYKSCVQILKKRQENYLLVQILYEMSLVMYSIKDVKNAEVYFNEALDTVFQKLYSIKDFRNLMQIGPTATEKYGMRNLCYAICILHKMNKYCYDNDLFYQRECSLMAAEITLNILNNSIPNPQSIIKYGLYRLSNINKNISVFKTSENVKASDLLVSLIELCDTLIAYSDYEMCLPMLCLCDYLSCDICKHINYTLRSRVLKVICLAELGFVSESMMVYYQIIKKLDMPTYINFAYKDNYVGKSFSLIKEFYYQNDLPPDNQMNIDAINAFMKLSIDNELKIMLGGNLFSELMYAKLSILFKVYQRDNYLLYPDKTPFLDQRNEIFLRIDKESRDTLQLLSAYEELCYLSNMQKEIKFYAKEQTYSDQVKTKIDDILNKSKLTNEDLNNYITLKYNKKDIDLSKERIELMFKFRILLSRMYGCQGLSLTSSGVLLKGIENFKKISNGQKFGVDLGDDFTFDFKPSEGKEVKGSKNPPAPQKKEVKKEPNPKEAKDKAGQQVPVANPEEEMNKIISDMSKYHPGRVVPNSVYWFKLNYLHLLNLFKMNRYTDCLKIIEQFNLNSQKVNDVFYYVRFKEIEAMIYIQQYDTEKCQQCVNSILDKGKVAFINDNEICYFYANYAEYLYISQNYDLALQMLKTSRIIIWEKMAKLNYIIPFQSKFSERLLNGLYIDKSLMNKLKDRESSYGAVGAGAKKAPTDPKASKGQNEIEPIDYYDPTAIESNFDNPKSDFVQGENLYFKYIDLICKLDLKYVLFQCLSIQPSINDKIALSILSDLEILTKKKLYPHSYYNIMINFLYGIIEKKKFIDDLSQFLNDKFYVNAKILKNNNLEVLTLDKEVLYKFSSYYNESCVNKWIPFLLKAKGLFEQAFQLSKTDFIQFENSFSILNIISQLADVNLLLAEYEPNAKMKYCDILQVVNKINKLIKTQSFYDKENDDLPYLPEDIAGEEAKEEKNNFIQDRNQKEKLSHITYLRNYIYFCELYIKVSGIKKSLFENTFELATNSNLVDASKLPKDITLQIIECDYITKKRNKDFTPNIVVKPIIDTFDVYNLMKNYIKEIDYFTFNQDVNIDEPIKNITKLHKFLKGNSANYNSKCYIEYVLPPQLTDPNIELAKPDQIIVSYITSHYEIINHKSVEENTAKDKKINLVYLLSKNSIDDNYKELVYGRILVSNKFMLSVNQKIYNMKIVVRQSMTFSEEKKQRDFRYFQIDYYAMVYDMLSEILKGKKMFNEIKNIKDYFKESDIGDVSIEALDFWFNILNFTTYITINQKCNALLNKIHLVLSK